MKKIIVIIAGVILLAFLSTSCKEWSCKCKASGYVSESTLDDALNDHMDECVSIANNGPIYDYYYDVEIACTY